jgi:hypothetical protein
MTMFVLQLKTHTICSVESPPFGVSVPETVNDDPGVGLDGAAEAVSIVETGFDRDPVLRFRVIVPGPVNETVVGSFEPEHASPPKQLQLESVKPCGT